MMDPQSIEAAAAVLTVAGGLYGSAKHFMAQARRKKEEYRQDILKQAKEEVERVRKILDDRISKVEDDFRIKQEDAAKDLAHMQSTYNSEIKVLGQRIEELRQDISNQHSSLVALLTKLVNSR